MRFSLWMKPAALHVRKKRLQFVMLIGYRDLIILQQYDTNIEYKAVTPYQSKKMILCYKLFSEKYLIDVTQCMRIAEQSKVFEYLDYFEKKIQVGKTTSLIQCNALY